MAAKKKQVRPEEHPLYHDTLKLLKHYRDVWCNVEVAGCDLQAEFRAEYGQSPADCLDQLAAAGADLRGTRIESFARSLERSRKMLSLIDSAVLLLRKRHKKGELYYWILYYSYLTPQEYENTEAILHALEAHFPPMSLRVLNDSALCTVIFADFRNEQIRIHNYTEDFLLRHLIDAISSSVKGNMGDSITETRGTS